MKRGILVYNPAAGASVSAARMHAVAARAAAAGVALTECPTSSPGDATRIVAESLASAPDLVVVAGGDGTIAEAAAALIGSNVPLAMLPYGTANVLAREYGAGADPVRAERVIASRRTRPLTAWRTDRRPCFMWVGVGFDARMIKGAHSVLKRTLGRFGIAWSGLAEFARYDFPSLVVEGTDERGASFSREATYAVAANIQRYGGEMRIAPLADPADDVIDLVLFTGRTHAALAQFLLDIGTGALARGTTANVSRVRARSVTMRAASASPEPVLIDGDLAGLTPISIGPVAGRVLIVVPQ